MADNKIFLTKPLAAINAWFLVLFNYTTPKGQQEYSFSRFMTK